MENCVVCKRSSEEVELFDGFYINENALVCERCSILHNIPIFKPPTVEQIKASEKTENVKSLVSRMAHIKEEEKPKPTLLEELDKIEGVNKQKWKNEKPIILVDNFHWIIQYMRRKKKMTQRQLAEQIGETETIIKLIENNHLPRNYQPVIKKLEQFFRVRLIKLNPQEAFIKNQEDKQKKEKKDEQILPKIENNNLSENINDEGHIQTIINDASKGKKSEITLRQLISASERIEKDFSKKTSYEIGEEQVESFGKENTVLKDFKQILKSGGDVPTIHELLKQKQEREKSIIGRDIELDEK